MTEEKQIAAAAASVTVIAANASSKCSASEHEHSTSAAAATSQNTNVLSEKFRQINAMIPNYFLAREDLEKNMRKLHYNYVQVLIEI